jgi:hypothetical protein
MRLHSSKNACELHVRPSVDMFQRDFNWTDLGEKMMLGTYKEMLRKSEFG